MTSMGMAVLSMDTPHTESLRVAPQAQAPAQEVVYRHTMNSKVHTRLVGVRLPTLMLILKRNA